jgi:hypothetical protein
VTQADANNSAPGTANDGEVVGTDAASDREGNDSAAGRDNADANASTDRNAGADGEAGLDPNDPAVLFGADLPEVERQIEVRETP